MSAAAMGKPSTQANRTEAPAISVRVARAMLSENMAKRCALYLRGRARLSSATTGSFHSKHRRSSSISRSSRRFRLHASVMTKGENRSGNGVPSGSRGPLELPQGFDSSSLRTGTCSTIDRRRDAPVPRSVVSRYCDGTSISRAAPVDRASCWDGGTSQVGSEGKWVDRGRDRRCGCMVERPGPEEGAARRTETALRRPLCRRLLLG